MWLTSTRSSACSADGCLTQDLHMAGPGPHSPPCQPSMQRGARGVPPWLKKRNACLRPLFLSPFFLINLSQGKLAAKASGLFFLTPNGSALVLFGAQ